MYCSRCGKPVTGSSFCSNCGQPTGKAGLTVPKLAASRIVRHLPVLGILWIAFAAYIALKWIMVLPFLHLATHSYTSWMRGTNIWMYGSFHSNGWLMHWITVIVLVRALLSLAVGIALLTRQRWGRIFAIVMAVLTLMKPLLGTLLAIYTLWVFLERDAGPNYEHVVLRRDTSSENGKSELQS